MPGPPSVLRLGTRGSLLARTQSQLVADELSRLRPGLPVELVTVRTTGDRITDRPLHDVGGKGLFTKELEQVLLAGEIDLAVHSYKDVPVTMPLVDESNLVVAAVPPRADPRDVAVMRDPSRGPLPRGARVGTSSLRRRCQLLEIDKSFTVLPLRGNIDTRLRKLREGEYDIIVLAMAGLLRAGLFDPSFMEALGAQTVLPAPGQGALALQCRRDDEQTRRLLEPMNHRDTALCVSAERAVVAALEGDCHSPIAALGTIETGRGDADEPQLLLRVAVGARDGVPPVVRAEARADVRQPPAAVEQAVEALSAAGARALLHGAG
jgi:hydroxymethylbilane synthase